MACFYVAHKQIDLGEPELDSNGRKRTTINVYTVLERTTY